MSLKRLYGLTEATRRDHQLSIAQMDKHFPDASACIERDIGAVHATFYTTGDEYQNLIANVKGGGWWGWSGWQGDGSERWERIEKPGSERGAKHKFRDDVYPNISVVRKNHPEAWRALAKIRSAKDHATFHYDENGELVMHVPNREMGVDHYIWQDGEWVAFEGGEYADMTQDELDIGGFHLAGGPNGD